MSSGHFGKGVYMTECSDIAYHYSNRQNPVNDDGFIFVNEVVKVAKLRVSKFKSYKELYDVDRQLEHPFTVYLRDCKNNIVQDCSCLVEDVKYKVDGKGRKYRDTETECCRDAADKKLLKAMEDFMLATTPDQNIHIVCMLAVITKFIIKMKCHILIGKKEDNNLVNQKLIIIVFLRWVSKI